MSIIISFRCVVGDEEGFIYVYLCDGVNLLVVFSFNYILVYIYLMIDLYLF